MLNHVHISCPRKGCYGIVTVHPQEDERLRRTGESFYCPAGHSMSFTPGPTKDQKRIQELERAVANWRSRTDEWRDTWEEERGLRQQLAHSLQVCPLGCGWHGRRRLPWQPDEEAVGRFLDRVGQDLTEHLLREHNATRAPVALLEAGEA